MREKQWQEINGFGVRKDVARTQRGDDIDEIAKCDTEVVPEACDRRAPSYSEEHMIYPGRKYDLNLKWKLCPLVNLLSSSVRDVVYMAIEN